MLVKTVTGMTASGSADGMTWSHNKGGQYIRRRGIPTNPATQRQEVVRQAKADLVVQWNDDLTDAQRTAWNAYAANVTVTNALGDPIQLSGQNWYVGNNIPRIQAGLAKIQDAPVIFNRGDPPVINSVAADLIADDLLVALDAAPADGDNLLYLGRPQNQGINFFDGPYRFVGEFDTDPIEVPFTSLPFTLEPGQKIWLRIRTTYDDGRLSSDFKFGPVTVVDTTP